MTSELHAGAIVIDGLQASRWSREVFEAMHAGGLTAVNCTCSVWEGFDETMANFAAMKRALREDDDLIRPILASTDIRRAKEEGRVGLILGWQNTSAIEDKLFRLELFHELGLRIVQLAYNTQNFVAAGCYETRDPGLTDFGREVIDELNRLGIVIDLSHVGRVTSNDVIEYSAQPVVYSHVCPAALRPHPRNKTDDELRFITERGGLVGVNLFPWFLPGGKDSTLDDFLVAIDHVVSAVGEDHVGIGTDFMVNQPHEFFEWALRDKGYARQLTDEILSVQDMQMPPGLQRVDDFENLTVAMEAKGWSESRIRKILGENWERLFGEVWRSP